MRAIVFFVQLTPIEKEGRNEQNSALSHGNVLISRHRLCLEMSTFTVVYA